jgi:hypothetical protein
VSFAVGAVDRLSGSNNPNGIYSARISMDGTLVSGFALDDISYNDTRYINAQLDLPYKTRGGSSLQHISPLPGARDVVYQSENGDGIIRLADTLIHTINIEVRDANGNTSAIRFALQYDPSIPRPVLPRPDEKFLPNNVNVFERENFELFTSEQSIYDTLAIAYNASGNGAQSAVSPVFTFLSNAFPVHDSVMVRIKPTENIPAELRDRVVIKNVSGTRTYVQKARWQNGWYASRFRQFGTYQAFADNEPPTVNSLPSNLSRASRIVFIPKDNFNTIRDLRVELDGQWLRFSNDKGKAWIYSFDEKFPKGEHELKVTVVDEAGNITVKTWNVIR